MLNEFTKIQCLTVAQQKKIKTERPKITKAIERVWHIAIT